MPSKAEAEGRLMLGYIWGIQYIVPAYINRIENVGKNGVDVSYD